jgi:hypothetical protein
MTETTVGERVVELLVQNGYGPRDSLEGCTEEDLDELERRYDITLPEAYRSCMRHIGRSSNKLFEGSHFNYPGVRRQTEFARDLAEDRATDLDLPDDIFVFHGLQGYAFDCFRTTEGEDPPVYLFTKFDPQDSGGTYELRQMSDSFSDWIFKRAKSRTPDTDI